MSPCYPFRPIPGQCGPHRRGPLPAPPFDPQDYWATRKLVSSLFGSLETTKLDKVDVVDPSTATEDGKAADAKRTYEELTRISGMASDAKELAESKADKATTLAGYGITDAATKIDLASKADLADGKVPAAQLPSFVDDVLEYDAMSSFPATGEDGKIYIDKETNKTYRWSGTQYVEISQSLALGETESTAYPGDKGRVASETASTAYDVANNAASAIVSHTENKSNPHAVTAEQIGAVPLVEDKECNKTAVTIGSRRDGGSVGVYSLANGAGVTASGGYSHAEGVSTTASGEHSHAEGAGTIASGDYSHAEGSGTIASGYFSHVEGVSSQAPSGHDFAYVWNGEAGRADPYNSHDAGTFNINPAGGLDGFWIGEQTLAAILTNKADKATTLASYGITDAVPLVEDVNGEKTAVTIGSRKDAQDGGSVGYSSLANGYNVNASGAFSHAEGQNTSSPGFCSHSEGYQTTATGDFSHTEGWGTGTNGKGSHAEGDNTFAFADYSHVAGRLAQTLEGHDHAFAWNGDSTRPIPYTSHDRGTFNINPVGGINGFWIGEQTLNAILDAILKNKADNATTLAGYGITDAVPLVKDGSGEKTAVTIGSRVSNEPAGKHSLVNGDTATASGNDSHAEGGGTTASGPYSHAEGITTTAFGNGSHAEGAATTASGPNSHAEGVSTTASGNGSHASGTKAQTREGDSYAYAWNGDNTIPAPYTSNGQGTFNINPVGGMYGFYIGEQTLDQVITAAIAGKANLAALAPEYSPSSSYSVGAIVYHDGNIYQCKTAIAEGGEAWNEAKWELRGLDDFFTESNSLLTGTIDAKVNSMFDNGETTNYPRTTTEE